MNHSKEPTLDSNGLLWSAIRGGQEKVVTGVAPEWPHVADQAYEPDVHPPPSGSLHLVVSAVWANTFTADRRHSHQDP